MSMFDKIEQLKNAPFADGPFMLYGGTYKGMSDHPEYGRNHMAEVMAGPEKGTEQDAEKFIVYGVLAEQIGRMTSGDLPAKVILTQDGRSNVFRKAD